MKKCKFYSNNLKEWVKGTVVKENEKTVWIEIPNSYKIVVDKTPIPMYSKIAKALLFLGKSPEFETRHRVLDKGVPNVIKKKKSQVVFYE